MNGSCIVYSLYKYGIEENLKLIDFIPSRYNFNVLMCMLISVDSYDDIYAHANDFKIVDNF